MSDPHLIDDLADTPTDQDTNPSEPKLPLGIPPVLPAPTLEGFDVGGSVDTEGIAGDRGTDADADDEDAPD